MALPALSRPYHTRRDCLLPDRSTVLAIQRSIVWSLKAHLMDQLATGSTGPNSRDPASVWTCLGSSNGVAGGLDGVDRWGSSFNAANLVWASDGVAHSWIALQNTALGVQLVIDLQSSATSILFAFVPISQPFSGGSGGTVSSRPSRIAFEVNWNYTSANVANWFSGWIADTTTGLNQRSQFLCAADGSFFFFVTRDGLGFATTCVGMTNPLNSVFFPKRTLDTNAVSFFGQPVGSVTTPGAFVASSWANATASCRRLPALGLMTAGGPSLVRFGGSDFANSAAPADPYSLDYTAMPIGMHALVPQALPYGVIPDFYWLANRTLIPTGTVNDPGGVISHVAIGDVWVPWNGPIPQFT
jgi:hypothetical protein